MLAKLASLRINFVITFFGAALIIFLIKLTPSLLPKYYFNFSTLFAGGGSEPLFIVDPPGVTGKKLCELMSAHGISENSFASGTIHCSYDFVDTSSKKKQVFSMAEVDNIYDIVIGSDSAVRSAIDQAAKVSPIKPLSDNDIKTLAAKNQSISDLLDAMIDYYATQFEPIIDTGSTSLISKLNELGVSENESGDNSAEGLQLPALKADVIARVIQAHELLRPQLTSAALARQVGPLKKSSVDKILSKVSSKDDIGSDISKFYKDSVSAGLQDEMTQAFAKFQITGGRDSDRKIIIEEINKSSLFSYIISIFVRLIPVILFGLIAGILFGRSELLSISLAGALAAFLLSWPLMLMWDRLVSLPWQDKKNTFIAFYAVYILSYFLVAHSSAILGAWFSERAGLRPIVRWAQAPADSALAITWREVATSVAGSLVINAIAYTWNVIIPLGATGPS